MSKQNVPALRLEGFSGEWEDCTLGEHSHVTTGSSDVQDADPDGLYPFFVRSQHVERSNKYLFDGEAILIPGEGRLGEIFHYYIGKFDFHQRVYRISDFEDIDGKYVYWAMQHSFKDHAMQNTVKATVDSLRQPTITGFIFQKPPTLEEQQAIGAVFTNLDAAINQHTLKHKALQQSKTALMQRMFPQEGQTVPELRLKGFSGEWEPVTFGELSGRTYGGGTPSSDEPSYWSGDIPWIQSSDVAEDGVAPVVPRKHITREAISCSATMQIPANSVAVVTRVGVGKVSFMPYSYATSQDFVSLSDLSGHPEYIALTVKRRMEGLADQLQGSTIKGITKVELLNQSVHFPPTLEEQQAIGAIFTNLDQLIAAEAQYIKSLKQAKTALLQRMFI